MSQNYKRLNGFESLSFAGFCALLLLVFLTWLESPSLAAPQVIAWGQNNYGQTNVPATATNVVALAGGDYFCMALRADGTVVAWGDDADGQTDVPPGLTNVVGIAGGTSHSMALRSDGTITMWGSSAYPDGMTVPAAATNIVAIALGPGADHSLVLRSDGTVVEWGDFNYGLRNIPPTARNIVSVAAGGWHALALRADGTVVAWGNNNYNQVNVPAAATNIVAIAAGDFGSSALRSDGTVINWGSISVPGSPVPTQYGYTNVVDFACPLTSGIGVDSFVALKGNGTLRRDAGIIPVAGSNFTAVGACSTAGLALVGTGPPVFTGFPAHRTVVGGATAYFRGLAAGAMPISYRWTVNGTNVPGATNSWLAVNNVQTGQDGSYYYLIASNSLGSATNGPMTLNVEPLEIYTQAQTLAGFIQGTNLFTASTIGTGPLVYQWQLNGTNLPGATSSSLVLTNMQFTDAGAYSVIVSNSFGAVTSSIGVLSVVPSVISSPLQDQTVFLGGNATFNPGVEALIPITYQWQFNGSNVNGATSGSLSLTNIQLQHAGTYRLVYHDAYETVTNSAVLSLTRIARWGDTYSGVPPPGSTNLLAVSAGPFHDLALNSDHTLVGWGTDSPDSYTPPAGLDNVIAMAAGSESSLALRADGNLIAWGNNVYGQTNIPAGLSNVVAVAAGNSHFVVLKSDGTVAAWGNNIYGQATVPEGLSNVVAVKAGEWTCMVLRADGSVVAWGAGTNNTGQDPNFGQSVVPNNLGNVVQIAAGDTDELALRSDGTIIGWGGNFYGEDNIPTGLSNIVTIAAGGGHSVALKSDGTVAVWGYNLYGETNMPVGVTNVVEISADGFHTLALVGDGPPRLTVAVSNFLVTAQGIKLSLPSRSGKVYALEYTASLSSANWTALPLVAGTGETLTLVDPSNVSAQRFYRVRQW